MARPPNRWDYLYDLKPIELKQHFVNEAAKLIAKDLEKWPLSIDAWENAAAEAKYRRFTEPGSKRPDDRVYEAAFLLARLELVREFEQIDDFMRNERWRAYTVDDDGRDAMLLICRYLVEQMLAIAEVTEGRIKRPMLVQCLEMAERNLRQLRVILLS